MAEESCPQCNTTLSRFKIGLIYLADGKRFCSVKCKNTYMNKNHPHESKVGKVFMWTFIILQSLFIILALPYIAQKPFLGFGSFGGFMITIIFSLFVSFIIAVMYGAARRGKQIGDIIEANHKKLSKSAEH